LLSLSSGLSALQQGSIQHQNDNSLETTLPQKLDRQLHSDRHHVARFTRLERKFTWYDKTVSKQNYCLSWNEPRPVECFVLSIKLPKNSTFVRMR
jgi:hypothetical protein